MLSPDQLRTALDRAGIGHEVVPSLRHPDRWVTAGAVSVEDFAGAVTAEHEQALDFLAGLHPGLTIGGPPMAVAERIFDAVMAEQRALKDEISNMERNLEAMRAHLGRASPQPKEAQHVSHHQ